MLPQSTLVKTLNSIAKGDKIVVRDGDPYYANDGYRITTVARVTKTQIVTADGTKYRRKDGYQVGYDWQYRQSYSRIKLLAESGIDRLMTLAEGQAMIDRNDYTRKCKILATVIRQSENQIKNLPLETLKQAAVLLQVATQEQIDKM